MYGLHLSILIFLSLLLECTRSEPSVLILAANLQQVVTSSTLEWVAVNNKQQKPRLDDAVVGAYQIMQDEPDEDNSAYSSTPGKPVYVCRAKQNGIWVSGQLRPNDQKCVVSLRGVVDQADRYEVLINTEGAARLSWVMRDKYTLNPQGAVTGGDEPFRTFIARRTANSHNKEGSLTHFLGKLDPADNFGKYTLVDQNNNLLEYEDGEILVETEPVAYELNDVKLDVGRKRATQKPVVLGHVTLKNEFQDGGVERVETVISYSYNYSSYWGHGHGLLTGLPLTVHFQNGTNLQGQWGMVEYAQKTETVPIEGYLTPGTAVNVTLWGNYGEWDVPYTADVTSVYKDGEKRNRLIKDSQRVTSMRDVMPEFDPIYFLNNNSFVPTTSTTTTTTTTTTRAVTTSRTTTSTDDVTPLTPPQVNEPENTEKRIPDEGNAINDKNDVVMVSDDALSLTNNRDGKGNASSVSLSIGIFVAAVICARQLT